MRPPSRQLQSVEDAFGRNGWHCEPVEGRDVLRAVFSAHHTRIEMVVQVYVPMNALAVMGEMPLPLDEEHQPYLLELLARANKTLNLGGFEYDLDRQRLVFRITNLFDRERYDADIVSSMVHCTVAEMDRIAPYASTVVRTPEDLLDDLDLAEADEVLQLTHQVHVQRAAQGRLHLVVKLVAGGDVARLASGEHVSRPRDGALSLRQRQLRVLVRLLAPLQNRP